MLGRVVAAIDRLFNWPRANPSGIVLLVDGPNVLREDFDVDLDEVRSAAESLGRVTIARLYLDEHATPGLIQAAEAHGFEVIVTSGDVDVRLAIDGTELISNGDVDGLAIASRDTDFKPLVETAHRHDIESLAIAPGNYGRSEALTTTANNAVVLNG